MARPLACSRSLHAPMTHPQHAANALRSITLPFRVRERALMHVEAFFALMCEARAGEIAAPAASTS